jgi:hypothetical protein
MTNIRFKATFEMLVPFIVYGVNSPPFRAERIH